MEQYSVTGMSCAACSARVEKAVSKVPGVTACSVSLLTNSMGVEGTAQPKDIITAVEAAGYGASQKDNAAAPVGGGAAERLRNAKAATASLVFGGLFGSTDVFFHGTYDVGLASAILFCGESCGHGAVAAIADHCGIGD